MNSMILTIILYVIGFWCTISLVWLIKHLGDDEYNETWHDHVIALPVFTIIGIINVLNRLRFNFKYKFLKRKVKSNDCKI